MQIWTPCEKYYWPSDLFPDLLPNQFGFALVHEHVNTDFQNTKIESLFTRTELLSIPLLTLHFSTVYSRPMTYQAKQLTTKSDQSWPAFFRHVDCYFVSNQRSLETMIQQSIKTNNINRNGHAMTGIPVCWTYPDAFQEGSINEPSRHASQEASRWFVPSGAFFWPSGTLFYNSEYNVLPSSDYWADKLAVKLTVN